MHGVIFISYDAPRALSPRRRGHFGPLIAALHGGTRAQTPLDAPEACSRMSSGYIFFRSCALERFTARAPLGQGPGDAPEAAAEGPHRSFLGCLGRGLGKHWCEWWLWRWRWRWWFRRDHPQPGDRSHIRQSYSICRRGRVSACRSSERRYITGPWVQFRYPGAGMKKSPPQRGCVHRLRGRVQGRGRNK